MSGAGGAASDGNRPVHRRGQRPASGRRSRSTRRASRTSAAVREPGPTASAPTTAATAPSAPARRPSRRRSSGRRRRRRSRARRTRPPSGRRSCSRSRVDVVPPGDVAPFGSLQMTVDGQPAGDPIPLEGYDGITLTVRAPNVATSDVVGVNYSGDHEHAPQLGLDQPGRGRRGRPLAAHGRREDGHAGAAQADDRAAGDQAQAARSARAQRRPADVQPRPSAGTLQQTVRAGSLLASAKRTFSAAGRATLTLRLTAAGRRQLRRAGSVKLTIVTTFTPSGGTPVRVTERVTARRSARASAAWRVMASRLTREYSTSRLINRMADQLTLTFGALADPTRRAILARLARWRGDRQRAGRAVSDLAAGRVEAPEGARARRADRARPQRAAAAVAAARRRRCARRPSSSTTTGSFGTRASIGWASTSAADDHARLRRSS